MNLEHQYGDRFELLIFSEAGKPVYSYTKREDAVTLMPLCSALIEYARKTQKETLQSIRTHDDLMIRFTTRSPLIIIVIHDTHAYVDLLLLVEQVEAQLESILTANTLKSVFKDRPTFDLKRLLYGSEKLMDATTNLVSFPKIPTSPWVEAFLALGPPSRLLPLRPHRAMVPIVVVPQSTRDTVHSVLKNVITINSKNIIFSLLFTVESTASRDSEEDDAKLSFKLTTVCNHHDGHKIKVADIHLILALLCGSKAQLASVESLWMPVCLPRFNKEAFLHTYIAYMNGKKNCVVMLSINREDFSNCRKSRDQIEEKLENLLEDPSPAKISQEIPISFLWYQTSRHVLWWQRSSEKSLSSILYYITEKMLQSSLKHLWLKLADETPFLGWHVATFQLYVKFDRTVTTNEAAEVIQQLTNWIKKEEDNLCIREYR